MEIQTNGIRMFTTDKGTGFPVILIHGYPLDHTIWEATIAEMKSGARVIAPDLRGFGASEVPEGPYRMSTLAADLAGLMDALNLPKAVLVGHSMGGYAALAFARAFPERLAGLGLISSQAAADAPERRQGRYDQAASVLQHGPKEVADGMTPKLTADHQFHAEIYRIILRTQPAGLAGALRGMAERVESTTLLPGISVPAAVVVGLDDQLIPPDRSREMARGLPHAELVELENAGHMPMMEKPAETAAAVDRLVFAVNGGI